MLDDSFLLISSEKLLSVLVAINCALLTTILYAHLRSLHRDTDSSSYHFKRSVWSRWLETRSFPTFQIRWNDSPFGLGQEEHTAAQIELSHETCEGILTKNEKSAVLRRPGNPIVKWDTNVLPGNTQCEDELAIDLITNSDLDELRDQDTPFWQVWARVRHSLLPGKKEAAPVAGDGSGDLAFFSLFDGHAGEDVSALLKRVMHASLAWALSSADHSSSSTSRSVESVCQIVLETFRALDNDIVSTPLDFVRGALLTASRNSFLPTPSPALMSLAHFAPCGTCALTAMLDAGQGRLYIANSGDSRAVAGWLNPTTGRWRCDTLTEDQEAGNPNEGARLRSEHPVEEADNIIIDEGRGPRVLAHGQPTRTFGGRHVKHTADDYALLCETLQYEPERLVRHVGDPTPVPHPTPPYNKVDPEMTVRNVRPEGDERLSFVIIATDGLWDYLSSEEGVLLTAAHMAHPHHSPVKKTRLPAQFPQSPAKVDRPYPAEALPGTVPDNSNGHWVFQDTNAATHLIRNAIPGDGDERVRRQVLSLQGPSVRKARDDMTVAVLFFDTGH